MGWFGLDWVGLRSERYCMSQCKRQGCESLVHSLGLVLDSMYRIDPDKALPP